MLESCTLQIARRVYEYKNHKLTTPNQGIIQELNLGVGSHVSANFAAGVFGGVAVRPRCKPPTLFCYISLVDSLI